MAIDPTAAITPVLPVPVPGSATDPRAALTALARAALVGNVSMLGEIATTPSSGQDASAALVPARSPVVKADPSSAGPAPALQSQSSEVPIADRLVAAVRATMAQAAPVQAGLAPMMANLKVAVTRPDIPENVRQAAEAVLEKALPTERSITASAFRDAVQDSGVFMEARLARSALPQHTTPAFAMSMPPATDMKAALLIFRAVVSTWLAKAPAAINDIPGADRKLANAAATPLASALAVDDIQPTWEQGGQLLSNVRAPGLGVRSSPLMEPVSTADEPTGAEEDSETASPLLAKPQAPSVTSARSVPAAPLRPFLMVGLIEEDVPEPISAADDEIPLASTARTPSGVVRPQPSSRPPPPYAGGPMAAQAVGVADLTPDLPPAELARRLLKNVEGALARQELLQIASLPEGRGDTERLLDTKGPRWIFDLPFHTPQGVAVAQFEVSRDGGGTGGGEGERLVERTWRARFSLDVEPLGPVHVQIALTGARTRVGLWAERPEAMASLRAGEEALSSALRQAELSPEIAVHPGSPVAVLTAPGRFVDRAS